MWSPNNLDLVRVIAQDRMREADRERARLGHPASPANSSPSWGTWGLRRRRPAEVRTA